MHLGCGQPDYCSVHVWSMSRSSNPWNEMVFFVLLSRFLLAQSILYYNKIHYKCRTKIGILAKMIYNDLYSHFQNAFLSGQQVYIYI